MSLSKRDFNAIAAALQAARIKQCRGVMPERILDELETALADLCTRHNPAFQRSKFYAGCQPAEEPV